MEDDDRVNDEDFVDAAHRDPFLSDAGNEGPLEADGFDDEEEVEVHGDREEWKPSMAFSYRAKIIELLKNLHSPEVKIYSEASKEFIALLRADSGGGFLLELIQLSPKSSELIEAWQLHQGKPGMPHILFLLAAIFGHPEAKSRHSGIRKYLDALARLIVGEKLNSIYIELNSQESRRQSSALSVIASIVKQGVGLASEVAKNFDFKLPVLAKLSGLPKRGGKEIPRGAKHSTRRAFVEFAMSFVEVGNARLLRWILQQRELYAGVLRGLGSDDAETVVYVLSLLRDRVLSEDSLIPTGLRSVLFGSATLEQLSYISGNPVGGAAMDMAHEVLLLVCTDSRNGLMPGTKLRGNEKRLLELMKKLKATESTCHKKLLLTIVSKRPSLFTAYTDNFPYHIDPRPSSSWLAAISLAADLISSVNCDSFITSLASISHDDEVHRILKSIIPRACSRLVINKGLLHLDDLVKHGSLRLILESVKLFCCLINAVDSMMLNMRGKQEYNTMGKMIGKAHDLPGTDCFAEKVRCLGDDNHPHPNKPALEKWMSLKQFIQDGARALLPDSQVLLKLLSSPSHKHLKNPAMGLKRCLELPDFGGKKLKSGAINEDIDIMIGGMEVDSTVDIIEDKREAKSTSAKQNLEAVNDPTIIISKIWGLDEPKLNSNEQKMVEDVFHWKLLEVLTLYLRAMPSSFDGSFDFFRVLPANPLILSINEQDSLLSLLVEYIGLSAGKRELERIPESMYKHLQSLVNILLYSQVAKIQNQAYILVRAAMISTGAFEQNIEEIDSWLFFLPGYRAKNYRGENTGLDSSHDLSSVIIPFLCDAVSTVGNNLYKYKDQMHKLLCQLENFEGHPTGFSPLILCILQKCFRLINSESSSFKLHERSIISLYVSNTVSLILQLQVDMRSLPGLLNLVLTEKFKDYSSEHVNSKISSCEWRPLKNLLCLSQSILLQQGCSNVYRPDNSYETDEGSLFSVLCKAQEILNQGHASDLSGVGTALSFAIVCTTPKDVVENFPLLLTLARNYSLPCIPLLSSVLFLQPDYLARAANHWPDMFSCLRMIKGEEMNNHAIADGYSRWKNELAHSTVTLNHLDSKDLVAAAAFGKFLVDSPFYALFSALLSFGYCLKDTTTIVDFFRSTDALDLLRAKLSEGSLNDLLSFLRFILFWSYQILSSYIAEPLVALEGLYQMCFTLVDCIFERILPLTAVNAEPKSLETRSDVNYIQDLVDFAFRHPIITLSLSCSLPYEDLSDQRAGDVDDAFKTFSTGNLHPMDHCLFRFISTLFEFLLRMGDYETSSFLESIVDGPRLLIQRTVLLFREMFRRCYGQSNFRPLFPRFYIFRALMGFMSPFELLELADWMFSILNTNDSGCTSKFTSGVFVCLQISDAAIEMLYEYLRQPDLKSIPHLFWHTKIENFDVVNFQQVYYKILHLATCLNHEFADVCLMKTVDRICRYTTPSPACLPLHMVFLRTIINNPLSLLYHCFFPTNKVKAKTLQLLIEVSPVHMSLFGQLFLGVLSKNSAVMNVLNAELRVKLMDENGKYVLCEDDYIVLLPTALSYIKFILRGDKQNLECLGGMLRLYLPILVNGFSRWKNFVTRSIFDEEYDFLPSSFEGFQSFLNSTLLGKAISVFRFFLSLNPRSLTKKQRLEIFNSVCPESAELLDCDIKDINAGSYEETLKLISEASAKVLLARLLLSPSASSSQLCKSGFDEADGGSNVIERESKRMNLAKQRFIGILVNTLEWIVRNFPQKRDNLVPCTSNHYTAVRFLEHLIRRNIIQMSLEIQTYLTQLKSMPFLNQFIRSSLFHRFEDPATLKAIRCILVVLSEGRFSAAEILELLLGHSQLVPTIKCNESVLHSSSSAQGGIVLGPLPSILNSVDAYRAGDNKLNGRKADDSSCKLSHNHCASENRKLELIRLLRILYHLRNKQQSSSLLNIEVMESKELFFLLLSVYSATLSEIDLELLHLMNEIESYEGLEHRYTAEMDYLWGNAAFKVREDFKLDISASNTENSEYETLQERRKILFRENVPVDSKLCAMTVRRFCYDRSSRVANFSLEKLLQDNSNDDFEISSPSTDIVEQYDPAFILRFSIHSLLMDYIEPEEFSRLGLLAITLVTLSSPDEDLRKLAYESLGSFKKSLESSRKSKETLQLQLLLTYLQNGISESWQKIPSIIGIFAAEASFILLDTSQSQFFTIAKFLMHSPCVNLKSIPLFHILFGSSSIHFKADRLWILRLLYTGLNLHDDAKIYKRDNILELLLSFYSSSLSDLESKMLILQITKKAVQLPTLAHHLLKECALLPWLSSILSFYWNDLCGDKHYGLRAIDLVLKVVNDVISSRSIMEWLLENALEQLSEISSSLYNMFTRDIKLMKINAPLLNSILHVIVSTLRLSQKRKIYQPHFTLSLHGMLPVCQAIDNGSNNMEFNLSIEHGIDVILMSAPAPVISRMDKLKLTEVVTWATSASLRLLSNQGCSTNELDPDWAEKHGRECLIQKILRWVTASVVIGSIANASLETSTHSPSKRPKLNTLKTLLEYIHGEKGEIVEDCSANEALSALILYLQQLLRGNTNGLPSVVLALCLLLFDTSSQAGGAVGKHLGESHGIISMLCSKIRCPAETNPAWRWSYYQPWRDLTLEQTEMEQLEQTQACRSLLMIFSNSFGAEVLGSQVLSHDEVEHCGLFQWEREALPQST